MRVLFVIPGDINLPTGGYRYDREIINAWKTTGVDIKLISINGNYPFPSEAEKQDAIAQVDTFPKADIAVVDGLLGGISPGFLQKLCKIMPVVALIHHPLCLENGLDEATAQSLKQSEKQGLEFISNIITTSPTTSKTVAELFGFNTDKIHTVLPGVDRSATSTGNDDRTINLLCVGSVIKRKGHKDLLLALSKLTHLDWRLDCIGSTNFDKILFDELQMIIKQEKLTGKIKFHGGVTEEALEKACSKTDVFVLPSLFEGYGMAYAEAIVRGIPVIGTIAGAIPETVPENCGILVKPSDVSSLANALETMISNETLRAQYKNNAIVEEPNFPTWKNSAKQFVEILKDVS